MSGHAHPDELTELEWHQSALECPPHCQYCSRDEFDRKQAEHIKTLQERLANPAKHYAQTSQERDTAVVDRETWRIKAQGYEVALKKINAIRNSIVGTQSLNWSEHAYPLVAALDEAGFESIPYEKSRADLGTLIERTNKAEDAVKILVEALEECAQDLLYASGYKGEYLQQKHGDVEEVEKYRALAAKYKEKT